MESNHNYFIEKFFDAQRIKPDSEDLLMASNLMKEHPIMDLKPETVNEYLKFMEVIEMKYKIRS